MSPLKDLGDLPAAMQQRRTSVDLIVEALRNAIRDGVFQDGDELNQVSLAEYFGTSRVPIREAMRQLQAEGLISSEAHRRAVVRGITTERLGEIFELRILLETFLMERAMSAIDDGAALDELEACCRDVTRKDQRDLEALQERNRQFHRLIYTAAKQETAVDLLFQLQFQINRYLSLLGDDQRLERERRSVVHHQEILRHLRARDVSGAADAMKAHINETREQVIERARQRITERSATEAAQA